MGKYHSKCASLIHWCLNHLISLNARVLHAGALNIHKSHVAFVYNYRKVKKYFIHTLILN